ncbi:MAG: hypothetical protein GXP49_06920 [Deltaproteobacteria bacterium]|nr:hypothetical protein [Deltaproteobacteria bacterium]
MLQSLLNAFETTLKDLSALLLLPALMGLLIHLVETASYNIQSRTFGRWFTIISTGWLGVPVHEFGHMFFCVPFMHRIDEVQLFSVSGSQKTLGFVKHSYNPKNPVAVLGNLFIGFGPLLLGSAIIWLCFKLVVPDLLHLLLQDASFTDAMFWTVSLPGIASGIDLSSGWTWLCLYVVFCTASHMGPSVSDIKSGLSGAAALFLLVFALNLAAMAPRLGSLKNAGLLLYHAGRIISMLMLPATTAAIAGFLLSWLAATVFSLLTEKEIPMPWR